MAPGRSQLSGGRGPSPGCQDQWKGQDDGRGEVVPRYGHAQRSHLSGSGPPSTGSPPGKRLTAAIFSRARVVLCLCFRSLRRRYLQPPEPPSSRLSSSSRSFQPVPLLPSCQLQTVQSYHDVISCGLPSPF